MSARPPDPVALARLTATKPADVPARPLYLRAPDAKLPGGLDTARAMRLRPATAEDAVALAAVHALAFDAPWPPEAFTGLLESPGVFALAAVTAAPVALILIRAVADEAEVLTLAVAPADRRRGAAKALLAAGLDLAAAAGAQNAFLEVAADKRPGHRALSRRRLRPGRPTLRLLRPRGWPSRRRPGAAARP